MIGTDHAAPGALLVVDVGRILFVGPLERIEPHQVMVPVFAAGLDREYELIEAGTSRLVRTAIAPADVVRSVDGFGSRMAVMPMDPVLAPAQVVDPNRAVELLHDLVASFDLAVWEDVCGAIGLGQTRADKPDVLLEAMALVRASSDENVPGAEIATAVGVSLSHLQHLFRLHVGTSVRSYRTWSRLVSLMRGISEGKSITSAGLAAGFFDSAHVARTFRQTFGVPPSFVAQSGAAIHIVPGSDEDRGSGFTTPS